ncbi:MAG: nucleotidyltransferase family protein [Caldilineaceae bacterium]
MQNSSDHRESENSEQRRLFFHCLRTEWSGATSRALAQLTLDQWQALVTLAEQQQVAPLFYHQCKRHQTEIALPPEIHALLQASYYRNAGRNLLLWKELHTILNDCHQQEIAVLVLKGAALLGAVYPNKALRQMVDLDLLVPETVMGTVVNLLLARGYQANSQIGAEIPDHFTILHHLPPFIHPQTNICVELHVTVAPPHRFYSMDIAELWAAAQPFSVAGESAFTLAPQDLLLYTCMHATYRHLFTLGARFLCDVDAIVRHYGAVLDWDRLVARAKAWQWHNGVFLGLYLAQQLLATPIPSAALQALQPAEFHVQIVEESLHLIFDDPQATAEVDGEFAQKWTSLSWPAKIGRGLRMVLLSRRKMATHYPSKANSLKIFLYYPVRVKDLVMTNLPRLRLLWHTEPAIADTIQRKSRLTEWLEKA